MPGNITVMEIHEDTLKRGSGVPRTPCLSPALSVGGRDAEGYDISRWRCYLDGLGGANASPNTPYQASTSAATAGSQESMNNERDITDITPSQPSSSTTTTMTATPSTSTSTNQQLHSHPQPQPTPTIPHQPTLSTRPTPSPPFSIRQPFSTYPSIDLFEASLKTHRNYYTMRGLATEVEDKLPNLGVSKAVQLQDPASLLNRRLSERRRSRRRQLPLTFATEVSVYEYDTDGGEKMPVRREGVKFNDDEEPRKVRGESRKLAEQRMSVRVKRTVQVCEQLWGLPRLIKPRDSDYNSLESKANQMRAERARRMLTDRRPAKMPAWVPMPYDW